MHAMICYYISLITNRIEKIVNCIFYIGIEAFTTTQSNLSGQQAMSVEGKKISGSIIKKILYIF